MYYLRAFTTAALSDCERVHLVPKVLIKNFFFILTQGHFFIAFRGRKWEGERERERNIYQLFLMCSPTGDQTCNLGMCPD